MIRFKLTGGHVATVDDVDAHLATLRWRAKCRGRRVYAMRDLRRPGMVRTVVFLHRVVLGLSDPLIQVDHINGDGLDCRRCNLRAATPSDNSRNARLRRDNAAGLKGVSWRRKRGIWEARIKTGGVCRYLGSFRSPRAAAEAYDEAARRIFGRFARLNFPAVHEQAA